LNFLKQSEERTKLQAKIKEMRAAQIDIPLIIGGKEIRHNGPKGKVVIPHEHSHTLATFHQATESDVQAAITAAKKGQDEWAAMSWESRAAVFMKAAELLSGPWRWTVLAATVLGQSKNYFQAEIDASCELIDFLRFNVYFAQQIYEQQPESSKGVWNRMVYRPLEGFVYAATPFNFTAIGGNLTAAPALMGNGVIWKPSNHAVYSNYYVMKLFQEAGLPDGVINFLPGDPQMITKNLIGHKDFAGLHYTGSTEIFRQVWRDIGNNISQYKSFPRIVGETGGKDFVLAHPSAHVDALVTALIRGAYEFAGQKCSAASRAYIPESLWPQVRDKMVAAIKELKVGNPEEHDTFVNAVIHENSWNKINGYIQEAKNNSKCQIIAGGKLDKSVGYFVEPTLIQTTDPLSKLICEEIFGPVLTVYVYKDNAFDEVLEIVDNHVYSLTGSIFAQDRKAIEHAERRLINASGNFYINDKPTGAVVGQQPFGGARASGTNDKAGSYLNLLRWVSPRTVKETLVPPTHYGYPYMKE
jgi:1-pyrroline-5-carboxylate dehydrogenase